MLSLTSQNRFGTLAPLPAPEVPDFASMMMVAGSTSPSFTSGYSVRVTDCFEGEEGVYIETSLLGPDKGEEIRKSAACPYVVVKMEYIDKQIIFQ